MAVILTILLFALAGLVHSTAVPNINVLPGFEDFKPCDSFDCWVAADPALRTLLRTGYEPLGFPKVDPLHVTNVTVNDDESPVHLSEANIIVTGLATYEDINIVINKEEKVINNDLTVNLTINGSYVEVCTLDQKQHAFDVTFETNLPGIIVYLVRHYIKENKTFDGMDYEYLTPTERSYNFDLPPETKTIFGNEYIETFQRNPDVQKWLAEHGSTEFSEIRKKTLENIVSQVIEAYLTVLELIDYNFPANQFIADFDDNY